MRRLKAIELLCAGLAGGLLVAGFLLYLDQVAWGWLVPVASIIAAATRARRPRVDRSAATARTRWVSGLFVATLAAAATVIDLVQGDRRQALAGVLLLLVVPVVLVTSRIGRSASSTG